jgi:hypothetical protein
MITNRMALKQLIGKRVIVTNTRGSRYGGILSGFNFNKNKFCLTHLQIINRNDEYTCSGQYESRWFNFDKFNIWSVK